MTALDLDNDPRLTLAIAVIAWAMVGVVVWRIRRAERIEGIADDEHGTAADERTPKRVGAAHARAARAYLARLARGLRRDRSGLGRGQHDRVDRSRVDRQRLRLTDDELLALARHLDRVAFHLHEPALTERALADARLAVRRAALDVVHGDRAGRRG